MAGKLYRCIKEAVKNGKLKEPFMKNAIKELCPDFKDATYSNYFTKHRVDNPSKVSEQFIRHVDGTFSLNDVYVSHN